ncbi:MAG: aspartate carbamoyltransferase catalytic subunit [Defluviitaleaceae bacterium]|nr:aspartate carbamoyltransferase catalytic subunit [Defluviitaleaceae bacterium]
MSEMKHLVTLEGLTVDEMMAILKAADEFARGRQQTFNQKVVANLFFEPSTRTQYSFEMAQKKLGIETITFNERVSSISKGETLYDTVKCFEAFGIDALVIRHPEENYFDQLMGHVSIPIFNAGDGSGQHPTQSLLDLFTIWQEFGYFEGLKIAIVGDVANSRVAHSNIQVMKRLGMKVSLVAPPQFQEAGYKWHDLDEVLTEMDIVMLLRVQHERHQEALSLSQAAYHEQYGLSIERERQMKANAIIMHPAPFNRGVEIADEVVACERSRIFKQMENGVYVRMAIMSRAFER